MAEQVEEEAVTMQPTIKVVFQDTYPTFFKYLLVLMLAMAFGGFHYIHVSQLFENDRNFSLLSPLEREMSLKTEMGFYYSYYKTIVEEKPLVLGLSKIMYDRMVEYPKEINAINRFNIHPEVVIGALFNYLEPYLNKTVECYTLDRGELSEVDTCVGLGVPIYFYLEVIWSLSGLTVVMMFLISYSLCGTVSAGLLCIIFYMGNHMDATRVMWTPNERENFAQPFVLTQMFLITLQLKKSKDQMGGLWLHFAIIVLNCVCLMCWQFTQFIFLTQILILFFMEQVNMISVKAFCVFLHGHFCGIHLALLVLQGNDMLKTSLYLCVFVVLAIYALFFKNFRIKVRTRWQLLLECVFIVIRTLLLIKISIWLKKFFNLTFEADEDSHVFDIFFAKLGLVTSFHTMIYTCSEVFDFMPYATWVKLTNTGVLPLAAIVIVNVCVYYSQSGILAADEYIARKDAKVEKESEIGNDSQTKPDEKCVEKDEDDALENLINAKDVKSSEDANSDKKSKDAKAVETPKDDTSAEKSKDAKTAQTPKDDMSAEKLKDAAEKFKDEKSAETPKDDMSAEKSKDVKSDETLKDDKSSEKSKDAAEKLKDEKSAETSNDDKSAEKSKDAQSAETPTDTKSTQTPNDDQSTEKSKDAKAIEKAKEAKATKKAKKAKTKQNKKNGKKLDKIVVYFKNLHIDSALFYHFAQMAAFGLMAGLVMRLKLLFVPHLCIVAACTCAYKYYTRFSQKRKIVTGVIMGVLVATAMYKARVNAKIEMSYVGQYSDVHLEELLKWITDETSATSVFAGPMPLTAVVMLTTRRAIVNHPHYENADARNRNYIVYKMFGRFPPQQYHDQLSKLKVTHLIIDKTYCYGQSTKGCSFRDIWDLEYPSLKDQPVICEGLVSAELNNFYVIFNNPMYTVVWVHDYSIKYNPKLLNT